MFRFRRAVRLRVSPAVSTRLRPAFLARYSALSAAWITCSTSCALGVGSAIPMLTVTDKSPVADSGSLRAADRERLSVAFLSSFLRPPSRRSLRRSGVAANPKFRFLNRNSQRLEMRHNFLHGFSAKQNGKLFSARRETPARLRSPAPIEQPPCSEPGLRCHDRKCR